MSTHIATACAAADIAVHIDPAVRSMRCSLRLTAILRCCGADIALCGVIAGVAVFGIATIAELLAAPIDALAAFQRL